MKFFISLFFVVVLLSLGCETPKKIQTILPPPKDTTVVVEKKDTVIVPKVDTALLITTAIGKMNEHRFSFTTFSAKVKVDFENDKGKQPDFTLNIRIKKDSVIWISFAGLLGIEGIRAVITKDSIKILDKQENSYIFRKLSYIQEISQLPMDFHTIQDLLIGNTVFFNQDSVLVYHENDKGIHLLSIANYFKNLMSLNADYSIAQIKLDDADPSRNRTCEIIYDDYQTKDGVLFSYHRNISVSEKSKVAVELKYKNIELNKPLDFPFKIPKKYKRR